MMNKGYTRKILKAIGDRKGGTFSLKEVSSGVPSNAASSAINRLLSKNIIVRKSVGIYELNKNKSTNDYPAKGAKRAFVHRQDSPQLGFTFVKGPSQRFSFEAPRMQSNKVNDHIQITPYGDGTDLIIIGDRIFLGTEVCLAPVKGENS